MPVIEEVEEEETAAGPTHTTVKMGAAARLQAFADEGGLAAAAAAAQEDGQPAEAGEEPAECRAPTWHAEGRSEAAAQPQQTDAAPAAQGQAGAGGAGAADGEGAQKELTEEEQREQEAMLERARALKEEGNALFGAYDYDAAVLKYTAAIEAAPKDHTEQAVFFNNRATCYFKQVCDCGRARSPPSARPPARPALRSGDSHSAGNRQQAQHQSQTATATGATDSHRRPNENLVKGFSLNRGCAAAGQLQPGHCGLHSSAAH